MPFRAGVSAHAQTLGGAVSDLHLHKFTPKVSPEVAARSVVDQTVDSDGISRFARSQMAALQQEKASRTAVQQKIDSNVLYTMHMLQGQDAAPGVSNLETGVTLDENDNIVVDIVANVTSDLLDKLSAAGARILEQNAALRSVRAVLSPVKIETIAASPDVFFINPMQEFHTHRRYAAPLAPHAADWTLAPAVAAEVAKVRAMIAKAQAASTPGVPSTGQGSVETEGDVTEQAYDARQAFGINGAGLSIGVISTGVATRATSQASGDLPPDCGTGVPSPCLTVIANAAGDEGTAILEIIHDMVPGANLYFASGTSSAAQFATNIRALRAAGCSIIVDDLGYYKESPFQDGQTAAVVSSTNGGLITQAVNDVVANGAFYFSSSGNEGALDADTSGTYEGDFNPMAATAPVPTAGMVHNFGNGIGYDTATYIGTGMAELFWADPLGGSGNDYDLYVLNAAGTSVVSSSTNVQNGTGDPNEQATVSLAGYRLVVYQKPGAANRFFHLLNYDGMLSVATSGETYGHPAATGAYGVAAAPAAAPWDPYTPSPTGPYPNPFVSSNRVEPFSSDGLRHIFFNADSTPITPGNFSSTGGTVLNKPDITGADGVSVTGVGGFGSPFYGTSAAAPAAASVAALVLSAKPTITPAQMRTALTSTAVDIMGAGFDRDSGAGVAMAFPAVKSLGVLGKANPELGTVTASENPGNGDGVLAAGEGGVLTISLKNTTGVLAATGITATLTTSTAGVTIMQPGTSAYADMAVGAGPENNLSPFAFTLSASLPCGQLVQFALNVTYSGGQTRVLPFTVQTGLITITNTLGFLPVLPAGITFGTGNQIARINRAGGASVCGVQKSFPSSVGNTSHVFDSYTFNACSSACFTTQFNSPAAGINLEEALYSPSFSPTSIGTNYKGDPGLSLGSQSFGVSLTAGTNYSLVVSDVAGNPPSDGLPNTYSIQVPICEINCSIYPLPIAIAKNVTIAAGSNGTAAADIDNGSNDPNGGPITLTQFPVGPYPVGVTNVTLIVTNKQGAFAQATGTVTVTGTSAASLQVAGIPLAASTRTAYTGTIKALDSNGNPATGFTGTVTLTPSDPSVTLNPTSYTFTAADAGVTSFQATFANPGTFSITGASGGLSSTESGIVVKMPLVFIVGTAGIASLGSDGSVTSHISQGGIGAAVDSSGSVWSITNTGLASVSPAGTLLTNTALPASVTGSALAIDGSSLLWVAATNGTIISVYGTNTATAVSSTQGSTSAAPSALVIDLSGDVWVANPVANTVDEIIGGAAPAAPLSTAVTNGTPGARP